MAALRTALAWACLLRPAVAASATNIVHIVADDVRSSPRSRLLTHRVCMLCPVCQSAWRCLWRALS